jgi:hypothetical protein
MATAKTPPTTPVSEMDAFLQRKALNTAPAWMPEPGTVVAGTVAGLRMGNDNGWGVYPVVVYKLDDGSYVSVHAFHTLLRERLAELKTDIGVRQILSYDGKKSKNNATDEEREADRDKYHMYYVENASDTSSDSMVEENFSF